MGESLTVLVPSSPEEAVQLFGDGASVTVVGGGTIVVPSLSLGRRSAERAMLLHRAGLDGIRRDGGRITIGATTTLDALGDMPDPLRTAVAHVADLEIRGQATIGGNICAEVADAPRGDLQGPLIALGAQVRSTGAGGERTEAIEDFLPGRLDRLVLDISFDEPAAGAYEFLDRPHTHDYTALAVAAARAADGTVRLGATGIGPHGLLITADHTDDLPFADDALASAGTASGRCRCWCGGRSPSSETPHEDDRQRRRPRRRLRPPDAADPRAAGRAQRHQPEGRLPGRRLRRLHRDRRRRAAAQLPAAAGRARRLPRSPRSRASARRSSWLRSSRPGCTTTPPSAASAPAA